MIRWGYLIPRLAAVATVVAFLAYGLAPLVRWAVVTYGSRALGARIEIQSLQLSLARAQAELTGLQVANPAAPARNLFRASRVVLELDRDALLERRLVVREGRISGLRIGDVRERSGALDLPKAEAPEPAFDKAAFCRQQLLPIAGRLQEDLERQLVTPSLCRQLNACWTGEYHRIEAEVTAIRERLARLKAAVGELREARSIPDPRRIEQLAAEVEQLRGQLERLPGDVRRLQDQVKQDAESVRQGRDHDLAVLRSKLKIESLDGESLSQYLLNDEQAARVQELLAWIEWTRNCIPRPREFARPQRLRGHIVRFGDCRLKPELLFERLAVDGEFRQHGQFVPFSGTVSGVTNRPDRSGQPIVVDIRTGLETPLLVRAVLDRSGPTPRDQLALELPDFDVPGRQLGKPELLVLVLAPSRAAVSLELELHGDALAGHLTFVQPCVHLEPKLAEDFGGQSLQERLALALAEVKQLSVTVELSGSLRRPSTRLRSDLGPQLAASLATAAHLELQARVGQLTDRIEAEVRRQLSEVEQLVRSKSDELLVRLDAPRAELEQLLAAQPGQWQLDQLGVLPQRIRAAQLPKLPVGQLLTR